MLIYLSSGLILGLSAGVAPGPLTTLLVTQTVTHGAKEGIKVAVAPLITDPAIILLSFIIGSQLASNPFPLGLVSLAGALYICYLAWESLSLQPDTQAVSAQDAKSIQKGVLTNFLNPHPYMFWITVGTPFFLKAWSQGAWRALIWIASFYVMLVGSKIVLSLIVNRAGGRLSGNGYIWINRLLGLLMLFFALTLAKDGIELLGLWSKP